MGQIPCNRCEFGEVAHTDGRTSICHKCRGTGWVTIPPADALGVALRRATDAAITAHPMPGSVNPPDPLQRSRTTRTLTAQKWRGCPGLQLRDRHGDRYIVADHPHQKGLDGSQVAAWLDDGRDRSAPAIVYAEDIAEVL